MALKYIAIAEDAAALWKAILDAGKEEGVTADVV